jgi:hypothetical protein
VHKPLCSSKLILSSICSCLSAISFIDPCIFVRAVHSCRIALISALSNVDDPDDPDDPDECECEYRSGLVGGVWFPWIAGLGGR